MQINFQMPTRAVKHYAEWTGTEGLGELAAAAEAAGFAAVSTTDHPVPAESWLARGGHHSFDPFVGLAFMAASTRRTTLLTNLAIAGYRSPYVTAKAAASLDLLSGGRVVLGMGAGYVDSEFAALEADFAGRGARFDTAIANLRTAWSGEPYQPTGSTDSHVMLPRPAQAGGPPIWIGGNSRRARRRVAELADGWMPFEQGAASAAVTGTDVLSSVDELARGVTEIKAERRELGRDEQVEVCFAPYGVGTADALVSYLERHTPALRDAGVGWLTWQCASRSMADCLQELERLGPHLVTLR